MNEIASWFYSIDEPYAGALFEMPERSRFYRIAYAQKKFWEQFAIPPYAGGQLFQRRRLHRNYAGGLLECRFAGRRL